MAAHVVLPRIVEVPDFTSILSLQKKVHISSPDPYDYRDEVFTIYWNPELESILICDTVMNCYELDCSDTLFTLQTVTPLLIMRILCIDRYAIHSSHCTNPNDNIHNLLDRPVATMYQCSLILREPASDLDYNLAPVIEEYDPAFADLPVPILSAPPSSS
jgi:hypothetical protein